jgi:3-hydroxyisobutyrate dehydrogenase-like beta-hydroxyacid dehydrogenase
MAARLLQRGHAVRVYDPVAESVRRLQDQGAEAAGDLASLCQGRQAVISMLPSDEILEAAATGEGGLTQHLPAGAVHVVSGTHGVRVMERLAQAHAAAGQTLVSCTVLGRPDRAAEGALGLIPAGPKAAVDAVRGALEALGTIVIEPGEDPLSAVAVKIANNFVLGCAIEAMGEAMALVRRYGVEPQMFYEVLTGGLFDCTAYRAYGDIIAKEDWGRIGATATIGLKDVHLALEAAERVRVPLPSGDVWRNQLLSAIGRGEADLDWSVMAREQFRHSALE